MSNYRGLFTFDVHSHKYIPIALADGIIDLLDTTDYVPTEPLIKDQKICEAVRAWADAIGVDDLFYCIDHRTRRAVFSWPGNDMAMELSAPVEGLDTGQVYTVAELCGEENE